MFSKHSKPPQPRKRHCIVIAIDTTASMKTAIDGVIAALATFGEILRLGNIQIKIIVFGDYDNSNNRFTKVIRSFSGSITACLSFINANGLNACGGGGDCAEAQISATLKFMDLVREYNSSALFMITDAPPRSINYKCSYTGTNSIETPYQTNLEEAAIRKNYPRQEFNWYTIINQVFEKGHTMVVISTDEEYNNLAYNRIRTMGGLVVLYNRLTKENTLNSLAAGLSTILGFNPPGQRVNMFAPAGYRARVEYEQQNVAIMTIPGLILPIPKEEYETFYTSFRQFVENNPAIFHYLAFAANIYFKCVRKLKKSAEHSKLCQILDKHYVPKEVRDWFSNQQFTDTNLYDLQEEHPNGGELFYDGPKLDPKSLKDLLNVFSFQRGRSDCIYTIKDYLKNLSFNSTRINGIPIEAVSENLSLLLGYLCKKDNGDMPEFGNGLLPVFIACILKWGCSELQQIAEEWVLKPSFMEWTVNTEKEIPPTIANARTLEFVLKGLRTIQTRDDLFRGKMVVIENLMNIINVYSMFNEQIPKFKTIISAEDVSEMTLASRIRYFYWFFDPILKRPFCSNLAKWVPHAQVQEIIQRILPDTFYNFIHKNKKKYLDFIESISKKEGGLWLSFYTINDYRDAYSSKNVVSPEIQTQVCDSENQQEIPNPIERLYFNTTGGESGSRLFKNYASGFISHGPVMAYCPSRTCNQSFYFKQDSSADISTNDHRCPNCRHRFYCHHNGLEAHSHNPTKAQKKRPESFDVNCSNCSNLITIPKMSKTIQCPKGHKFSTGEQYDSERIPEESILDEDGNKINIGISVDDCLVCRYINNQNPEEKEYGGINLNLFSKGNIEAMASILKIHPTLLECLRSNKPYATATANRKLLEEPIPEVVSLEEFLNKSMAYQENKLTEDSIREIYEYIAENGFKTDCYICAEPKSLSKMISICGGKCPDVACQECVEIQYGSSDTIKIGNNIDAGKVSCMFCRRRFGGAVPKMPKKNLFMTQLCRPVNKPLVGTIIDGMKIRPCSNYDGSPESSQVSETGEITLTCCGNRPFYHINEACGAAGDENPDAAGPNDDPQECQSCNVRRAKIIAESSNLTQNMDRSKFRDMGKGYFRAPGSDRNGRFCPNCNTFGEKDDACWSVTCSNCQIHFCWCCGMTGDIYDHLHRKFGHYNVQDTRHYCRETDTWISTEPRYNESDDSLNHEEIDSDEEDYYYP